MLAFLKPKKAMLLWKFGTQVQLLRVMMLTLHIGMNF